MIDPDFEYVDLLLMQRPRRRHLLSELVSDQPAIEFTSLAIAPQDYGSGAAPHRIAPPVQPKVIHLLRRSVAANAVCLQQRLNVATEINLGGNLGEERPGDQAHQILHKTSRWRPDYIPSAISQLPSSYRY